MGSSGTPPKSNINVKRLHGGGFVVPDDVQSLLREGSHTTFCVFVLPVFVHMALATLGHAAGAYYMPKLFKGVMEVGDGLFRVGADKICDATGLCTVGALTRKEQRQLDNYLSNSASGPVSMGRMRNQGGALALARNGTVQAHVAATRKLSSRPARFKSVSGKTIVSHTEFVSTAGGSSAGFLTSFGYRANPTNFSLFPWLSTIAGNFDKYRFTSLSFEYVPLQPTTQAGRVGLIFDFDSQDALPTLRADCYSYAHSVEGPVWDRLTLKVKTDSTVRFTEFGSTLDLKLIDLGQLIVFSDAVGSTITLGDVLVHYTVELIEPQPNPVLSSQAFHSSGGVGLGATVSKGAPLVKVSSSSTFTDFTATFLNAGAYIVMIQARGGTMGGGVNIIPSSNIVTGANSEAVSSAVACAWIVMLVKQPLETIRFNSFTSSAPDVEDLIVSRIGFGDVF